MSDSEIIQLPRGTPKELSAAQTLIPYRRDDDRSKYLGYLCCGFSDEEALYVLRLNNAWLNLVRENETFADLELRIPELRKELSQEYMELDFSRNFRLVMEKDHQVLRVALGMEEDPENPDVPLELTPLDAAYLLKLRTAYTPQQLSLLSAIAGDKGGFNFAEWISQNQEVVQVSRSETVTLARGTDG